jgi:hypothetical protein
MYDLDKTQEWLNRTIQLNSGPAVRGGVSSEPHSRKHTVTSILVAFAVIAAGMLLMSWTRGAGSAMDSRVAAADGQRRAAPPANLPHVAVSPVVGSAPVPARNTVNWPALSLDGDVRPLPGHSAPPAPVWLDGPLLRR